MSKGDSRSGARFLFEDDELGEGSTQASEDATSEGKDKPFWDALNAEVKSLHGVISGHGTYRSMSSPPVIPSLSHVFAHYLSFVDDADHGNEWCKRDPAKDIIFCFDKHSG